MFQQASTGLENLVPQMNQLNNDLGALKKTIIDPLTQGAEVRCDTDLVRL